MVVFLLTWLYIGFTFEVCPFFWDIVDSGIFDNPYFFYYSFIILSLVNFFMIVWKESFNNNKDILYKFFSLSIRPFSIFFTLSYSYLKRFFFYIISFEYKSFITTVYNLLKNIDFKSFLGWRPIFKKWSYFGYFRSNKSKWWKNK